MGSAELGPARTGSDEIGWIGLECALLHLGLAGTDSDRLRSTGLDLAELTLALQSWACWTGMGLATLDSA